MKSNETVSFKGLDQHEENCGDDGDVSCGGDEIVLGPDRNAHRRLDGGHGHVRRSSSRGTGLTWLLAGDPHSAAAAGTKDNIVGHFGVTLWAGDGHEFSGQAAGAVLLAAILAHSVNLKGVAGKIGRASC